MTEVPINISSHRELATFRVANLQHHEVILGMPWLRDHNPTIDWREKKIKFNSEPCTTLCLNSPPVAYAVPEAEALEENLITRFSKVQAKDDQSVKVKKLSAETRVPTKGSAKAAGHDLNAKEETEIPAGGQEMVGTGIAINLPHNTYGRIAPRSSLAVNYRLTKNTGVIDADYRGEVKVVLVNQGNQPYRVEQGDWIAQLIIEKINNNDLQEIAELDDTIRGNQGFDSSNTEAQGGKDQGVKGQKTKPRIEINKISARAFGQFYRREE